MKAGIIICTRLKSSRLPNKVLKNVNGKLILEHLLDRLSPLNIPIILAMPRGDRKEYDKHIKKLKHNSLIYIYSGEASDPLQRMYKAATKYNVANIIRITHDKIFVDPNDIYKMLDQYHSMALDYAYSSTMLAGSKVEIFNYETLKKAAHKYKNVEHISYAIKTVTSNHFDVPINTARSDIRLLIDFPADLDLMNTIFANLGNDCTITEVIKFLNANQWAKTINTLPKVTVYTCCYNNENYIGEAMASVSSQSDFNALEYILVDDHSTDQSSYFMSKFASLYTNVRYIRNPKNLGLASSSNVALSNATSEYIVRLDADDYFVGLSAVDELYKAITERDLDAVYPSNYFGTRKKIQKGADFHHVGGTVFKTSAINHIKFTEGLRNHEGLDLFVRAKEQLKIGYLNRPIFFYTQRVGSMSNTNLKLRSDTKAQILKQANL